MTSFLTALSPEEQVQGSRDPLGLLPIWSRLGRAVIGNVTTVSGDLRGWTTLLLIVGIYRERVDAGVFDAQDLEPLFRAEQLVAYSRFLYGDSQNEVRGLNQVKRHLNENDRGKLPIRLGTQTADRKILNSQQAAGVVGQIGSPASSSRLINRAKLALLPDAHALWTGTLAPPLASVRKAVDEILRDARGFAPAKADEALARAVAGLHAHRLAAAEVSVYRDHILHGGNGPAAPQAQFVEFWRGADSGSGLREGIDIPRTAALAQQAATQPALEKVALALRNIVTAEGLLAPMERLFSWVQSRNRQTVGDVVDQLAKGWEGPIMSAERATDDSLWPVVAVYGVGEVPRQVAAIRTALASGHWRDAVVGVIELNATTMKRRGGAPWITIDKDKLDVRLSDEQASLPTLEALNRELVHSYYLDPLRRLIMAWEDGQNV